MSLESIARQCATNSREVTSAGIGTLEYSGTVWSLRAEKKIGKIMWGTRVVRRQFASVEKFCAWQAPEIWIEGVGIFEYQYSPISSFL